MTLPDSHVLSEKSAELESTKEAYHAAIGKLHVYLIQNNIKSGNLYDHLKKLMSERKALRNLDVDSLIEKRKTVGEIVTNLIGN